MNLISQEEKLLDSLKNESPMVTELNMKPVPLLGRTYVHLFLLAFVALIAYSNSFHVPFIFDDEPSITKNEVIYDLANFLTNRSGYEYLPNRYIGYLSFALNYHFGGMNVVGYHIVNLAIHIANGLLVYAFARLTFRTPFFTDQGSRFEVQGLEKNSLHPLLLTPRVFIPFFAALLFVIHPVQTQAVTYIVQRLTSLATLFFMASLVLHIRWRLERVAGTTFTSVRVLPAFLISLITALLAMKTKEIAFTLPLVVVLYEYSFFARTRMQRLAELTPIFLTFLVIPFTMITLHKPVGEILSDVSKATAETSVLSRWDYLCTQFSVIVTYLRLLVLPINQNLDYDYPVNHSLLEPRAFLSLALLLAVLGLAIFLFWRSKLIFQISSQNNKNSSLSPVSVFRLAAFGILWFFLTLSVESSVIPITDVIFEHRLYLPSIGFFVAVATLAFVGMNRLELRNPAVGKPVAALLIAAVLLLMGATYARNKVWMSWETLWSDVKKKSPYKARAYNNLGAYYVKQERPAEAIREFEKAVELNPGYLDSLYNLAMLYVWAGRYAEAKQISDSLQKLDPETFRTLDAMYGNK